MKKPKVCFVTSFFYPTIGGVETHILNVGKELIKLGYDVEVFVSDLDRDKKIKDKETVIEGIKVRRFKSIFKLSFSEIFFPGLFKAVKNSDADIFHVHGYRHSFNFIFWFTNKPCFITPHWPIYKGMRTGLNQFLVDSIDYFFGSYIFRHFKKVCVVTDLESPWVESFKVNKENIILTPNCLPKYYFKKYNSKNFRKKYNLSSKDIIVLSVSRLHQSKGIDQLINVAKFFPEVKFVIMGKDGGERENLEQLIKDLKIYNIILAGEVTETEKLEAYAGSDIFCSPSHYEAFCISILEGMSQGCAVLTSNQGGMPWVVGDCGLIFKDYDLEDFKLQLGKLVSDRKLREIFKKKGLIRSKDFTWDKVAKALDKNYTLAINKL